MKKILSVILCVFMFAPLISFQTNADDDYVYIRETMYEDEFDDDIYDNGWIVAYETEKSNHWEQVFDEDLANSTAGDGCMRLTAGERELNTTAELRTKWFDIPNDGIDIYVSFAVKKTQGKKFRCCLYVINSPSMISFQGSGGTMTYEVDNNSDYCWFEFKLPNRCRGLKTCFAFSDSMYDGCAGFYLDSFSLTYDAPYTKIKYVSLYDFVKPVANGYPNALVHERDNPNITYNVVDVEWHNAANDALIAENEKFKAKNNYYAVIKTEAASERHYLFEWTGGGQGIYHLNKVTIDGETDLIDFDRSYVSASGEYIYIYTKPMAPATGPVNSFYIITSPSAYAAYDIRQNPPQGNLSDTTAVRMLYRNWIDEDGNVADGYFKYGKTYTPHFVVGPKDGYYFEDDTPYATSQGTFTGSPDEYGYIHVYGNPVKMRLSSNGVRGQCGTNCLYVYDKGTKIYMLMGTGVYDYSVGQGLYWDEMEVCAVCDGITELPECFVIDSETLKTVWLEDSVKKLGNECFVDCYNIEDIVFSDSLEEIGDYCFNSTEQVTELVFPQSLKSIGNGCFNNMTNLSVLELNEGLKTVGKSSFCGNSGIEEVYIPASVTKIDDSEFTETFGYDKKENKIPGFTVRGFSGTEAESFANRHEFIFISLGDAGPKYDVNGDGLENNKDIIALFKYLSGDKTVTVVESKLDINGDGGVNNKDIIALFNALST